MIVLVEVHILLFPFIFASRIALPPKKKIKKQNTCVALEVRKGLLTVLFTYVCAHTHTGRGQGDTLGGDDMLMALIMIILWYFFSPNSSSCLH